MPDAAPGSAQPLVNVRGWEIALVAGLALLLYLPRLGSYGLWDPWETHYAEVGRRMLEDGDYVLPKWQNESFRSKPVLTFWLMAAGLRAAGTAEDGGWSGEFVASHRAEWGLRTPFMLFGVGGIVALWYAVARLRSKRAAWLAAVILATSPYYFFITRQAITDMPAASLLIGSMALFAVAVLGEDRPLDARRTGYLAFLAVLAVVVLGQLGYFTAALGTVPGTIGVRLPWRLLFMVPFYLAFVGFAVWSFVDTRSSRQVALYWFYLLSGVAILAKGPVAPAVAALAILGYLAITGEWRLLARLEIPRGLLIVVAVALPWHFAVFLRDGMPWYKEYVGTHLLGRAFQGVHGDRGTFAYFVEQAGIGMWPWIALLPAALAHALLVRKADGRDDRFRLLVTLWAVLGFLFFSIVQTKFHHYLLPIVPAFAVLVAFWLDDALAGRARGVAAAVAVAALLFVATSIDLVSGQHKLVHLFIYRYDRPYPYGAPWHVDLSPHLAVLALVIGLALVTLMWRRARRMAAAALCAGALAFAVFAMDVLMIRVTPHWGQRQLHEIYYRQRQIHGVDVVYLGARDVLTDWETDRPLRVPTFVPDALRPGDPMTVSVRAGGETVDLAGRVAERGDDAFTIAVPPGERARLAPLLERARASRERPRGRWLSIDADRLIAWQLNWRGENFYSGGEIYDRYVEDARTVFMEVDNKKFLAYLNGPERKDKGRKFWLITEIDRVKNLPNVLPTERAKETLKVESESSNKYGFVSFTL